MPGLDGKIAMLYHRDDDSKEYEAEPECWLCENEECICDALTDAAREDA